MKKQITAILIASMLAIMAPLATSAQTRYCNSNNREYRDNRRETRQYYDESSYDDADYYGNNRSRSYDRHRKAINLAIGTGAGVLLGALIGGRKGALIGAAAGLAGGAIVTRKQRPRNYSRIY